MVRGGGITGTQKKIFKALDCRETKKTTVARQPRIKAIKAKDFPQPNSRKSAVASLPRMIPTKVFDCQIPIVVPLEPSSTQFPMAATSPGQPVELMTPWRNMME